MTTTMAKSDHSSLRCIVVVIVCGLIVSVLRNLTFKPLEASLWTFLTIHILPQRYYQNFTHLRRDFPHWQEKIDR